MNQCFAPRLGQSRRQRWSRTAGLISPCRTRLSATFLISSIWDCGPLINLSVLPNTTFIGKICRYPLRIIPRTMTVPILQGPLKGKKWIVGSQRHAFWVGSYEPHMQHLIAREVKPGQIFYDVGANVGFYTLLASVLVGPGRVFAFEPLPANIGYLRQHLALNAAQNVE